MADGEFLQSLKCDLSEIGKTIVKLEAFSEENALPNGPFQQVVLVLDELLTNVISYGFPDVRTADISVSANLKDGALHVMIEDNGVAFDPLREAAIPDIDANMEDRNIGGLGVHIAKTMMDDISYLRVDNKNQLRFHKNLG